MHPFHIYFPNFRVYASVQLNQCQKDRAGRIQRVQRNFQQQSFRGDYNFDIHHPDGHGRIWRSHREGIPTELPTKHDLPDRGRYGADRWLDYQAIAIGLVLVCLPRRETIDY